MQVVVQVFALAEPNLKRTLDAYAACDVPESVDDIRYQACVTPRLMGVASTSFEDDTASTLQEISSLNVTEARRHPVFEFVPTPPGKLTSRNVAHASVFDSSTDAVVVGDGDAPPAGETYLKNILSPLVREDTVATNGFSKPSTIGSWLIQPARRLDLAFRTPLYGRSSAFTARGWREAGPFSTESIVETNNVDVRQEEEFAFRRRLEESGEVIDVDQARVYNDNRRYKCSLDRGFHQFGRPISGYCGQIGVESFQMK